MEVAVPVEVLVTVEVTVDVTVEVAVDVAVPVGVPVHRPPEVDEHLSGSWHPRMLVELLMQQFWPRPPHRLHLYPVVEL